MNNDIVLNNSNLELIKINNISNELNDNAVSEDQLNHAELDSSFPRELASLGDDSTVLSLGDSSIGSLNSKAFQKSILPTFQVNIEFPKESKDSTFNLTSVNDNEVNIHNDNHSRSSVSLTTEFSAYSSLDGN